MDVEGWRAKVHEDTKSWTRLSRHAAAPQEKRRLLMGTNQPGAHLTRGVPRLGAKQGSKAEGHGRPSSLVTLQVRPLPPHPRASPESFTPANPLKTLLPAQSS